MRDEMDYELDVRAARYAVEKWNLDHPIGTVVLLRRDDGRYEWTRTRSHAAVLGNDVPVLWLEGHAGCWLLDRVEAVEAGNFARPAGRDGVRLRMHEGGR